MWGKDDVNEEAPWRAPKWIFPIHEPQRVVSKYILNCRDSSTCHWIQNGSRNIQCDVLGYSGHIPIEFAPDIVIVAEDKCLLKIKSNSYDIRYICPCVRLCLLYCPLRSSSVNMIISGTSNTSCNYLQRKSAYIRKNSSEPYFVNSNGTVYPTCILSLIGPRPVYKKNGPPTHIDGGSDLNLDDWIQRLRAWTYAAYDQWLSGTAPVDCLQQSTVYQILRLNWGSW